MAAPLLIACVRPAASPLPEPPPPPFASPPNPQWVWSLVRLLLDFGPVAALARVVRDRMGITERELLLLPWWRLVDRLAEMQREGAVELGRRPLCAHDVASRIL